MPCNRKVFAESNTSVYFEACVCMNVAVDGGCGQGSQMLFDCKASAE